MLQSRKFCLNDLNPHLLCVLCGGYFVDATTIIECLHSFCKTCIVRYLETSKYCPICDVQVHKTKPLQNIRSDRTLQDIVYKLVPGLFQKEMQLRRQFYADHPDVAATSREDAGDALDSYYFYSADDQVSLSLQYAISASSSVPEEYGKRYLRCPAAVTIAHLQKLLRGKHGLSSEHRVDICHEASQPLSDSLTLMDVAYIFQWQRKRPMQLFYQIYDRPAKRRKLNNEDTSEHTTSTTSSVATPVEIKPKSPVPDTQPAAVEPRVTEEPCGEPWKEVQLQISETGIMKAVAQGKETIISSGRVESPPTTSSETEKPATNIELPKESVQQNQKIEASDINGNKKEILPVVTSAPPSTLSATIVPVTTSSKSCAITSVPSRKEPITNEQKDVKVQSTNAAPTKDEKLKHPKPSVNKEHKDLKSESVPTIPIKASPTPTMKKPTSSSVGYKTLKLPPKSWNPSVSRGSYMATHSSLSKSSPTPIAPKQDVDVADTSRPSIVPVQNKPPRFFKERDRPRFLGNPVSGVKPMYQIQSDIPSRPNANTSHGSSSMVKIDPKTLSPMTSKAPSTSHNNNHLSCNSVTSSTGTITTTTASSKFSSKSSTTSMSPLPPVLHPPPNPLLYNYPGLINSPLMRPPIIHANSPHHFPPYPMPQAMFYGSQSPRFPPHSLPAVQRVPANMHPQKSPPMPTTTHVPSSTVTSHKPEIPKVNGEIAAAVDKSAKKESATEKLEDVAKPQANKNSSIPQSVSNGSNSTDVNKLSNGSSNNETFESSSKQALKVKSVDSNEKCSTTHPEPSKSVPPAASSAQNTS
ncbi:hypothetical protein B566_EDAN012865 [Ephemera danica]|nr:hypothetical protein B566_EDAN012865 [Ephemera danica]